MESKKLQQLAETIRLKREMMDAPLTERGLEMIANALLKPLCEKSCYGTLCLERGWVNHVGRPFLRKNHEHTVYMEARI